MLYFSNMCKLVCLINDSLESTKVLNFFT
uniref:Uncharacterized protein n=1 Tax=Anguilla anguilla TaxID=7936 RepID=A0A0E9UL39_ANGAN